MRPQFPLPPPYNGGGSYDSTTTLIQVIIVIIGIAFFIWAIPLGGIETLRNPSAKPTTGVVTQAPARP